MKKSLMFALASIVMIPTLLGSITAETYPDNITPIGPNMGIEKTISKFSVSENNSLPWGFVEGTVHNAVPDHPVIIQIYDDDDLVQGNSIGAVHFAQTNVNEDGTYQYKFRVSDIIEDSKINIFEGDYTVKIFKVVYLDDNLSVI